MNDALLQCYIQDKNKNLSEILYTKKLHEFHLNNENSSDLATWHNLLDYILPLDGLKNLKKSAKRRRNDSESTIQSTTSYDTILAESEEENNSNILNLNINTSDIRNLPLLHLPHKSKDELEVELNFVKMFIKGSYTTFQNFTDQSKCYFDKLACGKVWQSNYVAFRCKTCAFTPCMSLCSDCFFAGDHRNCDYMVFLSDGGACDCGLDTVMKASGFCKKHQHVNQKMDPDRKLELTSPENFRIYFEHTIPRILEKILHNIRCWWHYRQLYNEINAKNHKTHPEYEFKYPLFRDHSLNVEMIHLNNCDIHEDDTETTRLILFLAEISEIGGALRKILVKTLLDTEMMSFPTNLEPMNSEESSTNLKYFQKYSNLSDKNMEYLETGNLLTSENFVKNSQTDTSFIQAEFIQRIRKIYQNCSQILPKFTCIFDELFAWLVYLRVFLNARVSRLRSAPRGHLFEASCSRPAVRGRLLNSGWWMPASLGKSLFKPFRGTLKFSIRNGSIFPKLNSSGLTQIKFS